MTHLRLPHHSRRAKRGDPPPTLDAPAQAVVTRADSGETPELVGAPAPPTDLPPGAGTGKPPYRIPLMTEIDQTPWNGLKSVSTFSGCGGSCLGFRMAGFQIAWASEFVPTARETYLANHPHVHVDARDIRKVTAEEILQSIGLKKGELDVFEGSPPCASFSMAGKREKLWGKVKAYSDVKQRTDDLFAEYLRLLGGLMPRAFVAENVAGMVVGTAKGHFLEAIAAMKALGYRVGARLLDAQWLGVPQARRRVIFVGIREDLGFDPPFPKPLTYRYSIRDALPWLGGLNLPPHGYYPGREVDTATEPSPTVMADRMGSFGYTVTEERPRVVHDTSGLWGAGDVTDRPAPTITVGMDSINSNHFKVYAPAPPPVLSADGHGWYDGGEISIDRPAPTIPATPGAAYQNYELRAPDAPVLTRALSDRHGGEAISIDEPAPTLTQHGFGGNPPLVHAGPPDIAFTGGYNAGNPVSLDAPSPAVMAAGIGGVGGHQLQLLNAPRPTIEFTGGFGKGKVVDVNGPSPTVMAAGIGGVDDTQLRLRAPEPTAQDLLDTNIERFAIGREWATLQPGEGSDRYINLSRSHPDKPSPCVTASAGQVAAAGVTHPLEPRKFTIAELRRLCGFPDDFKLTGSYAQQWERLGRAVPPPMMEAVARTLAEALLDHDAKKGVP